MALPNVLREIGEELSRLERRQNVVTRSLGDAPDWGEGVESLR
jgi:hypothetical protein